MLPLKIKKHSLCSLVFAVGLFLVVSSAQASTTNGTIDATNKYAWGERIGWLNFGTTGGNVLITDTAITGYIWSENYGWINFAPTGSGVTNDSNGNLSGSAWGENLGYVNFSGVIINSSGVFTGKAIVINSSSTINFDCTNCKVSTDWRPANSRSSGSSGGTSGVGSSGGGGALEIPEAQPQTSKTPSQLFLALANAASFLRSLLPSFLQPKPEALPNVAAVPVVPQPAFLGRWDLLLKKEIEDFVLTPLPKEIAIFINKFPTLEKVFKEVGITRQSDLKKLQNINLTLPGLTETARLFSFQLRPAKFAVPEGVPVALLPGLIKQNLPTEVVFARGLGEKIDFDTGLTLNQNGTFEEHIRTIAGSILNLAVKPEGEPKSVRGFLVFKNKSITNDGEQKKNEFTLRSALASIVFSSPSFAEAAEKSHYVALEGSSVTDPVYRAALAQNSAIENRLALLEFEYTDPDHDGIYTAEVKVPRVEGEYEVITLIDYKDPSLGTKEIRLTTVVDPEGYVYEKNDGKETRVPGAVVSLYVLNQQTQKYELWPAKNYEQVNPQVTDERGTYAFLVPQGFYYISVVAPGYIDYKGAAFEVRVGNEIHFNIELKPTSWWLSLVDFRTALLILVVLLLVYNFYKDKTRGMKGQPVQATNN